MMDMMSTIPGHRSTHVLIQPILPAHLFEIKIDDYRDDGDYISERIFMDQSVVPEVSAGTP